MFCRAYMLCEMQCNESSLAVFTRGEGRGGKLEQAFDATRYWMSPVRARVAGNSTEEHHWNGFLFLFMFFYLILTHVKARSNANSRVVCRATAGPRKARCVSVWLCGILHILGAIAGKMRIPFEKCHAFARKSLCKHCTHPPAPLFIYKGCILAI